MTQQIAHTAYGPMEYRVEGRGPAVVVLQGGHCSRDTRLSHELLAGAGYTVITPSRPGYDATPASVGPSAQGAADALAALLHALAVPSAAVIGISAGGPTALALAQRHPDRVSKLLLESAMTLPWQPKMQRVGRLLFGPTQRLTWALLHSMLRLMPDLVCKSMLAEFTTMPVAAVWGRMGPEERGFLRRLIASLRSGTGFRNDLGHRVDSLHTISAPTLVMASPNDKSVPLQHAHHAAREIPRCELFEVPADSHLIWAGPTATAVWGRRITFLAGD